MRPSTPRVAAQVMFEQCQGYDQRHQCLAVVLDEAQQFLLVFAGEILLQIAHQVLEHVDMLGPGRFAYSHHAQALHEQGPVLSGESVPVPLARVSDKATHLGIVFGAVGHERQLVGGMELDQATWRGLLIEHSRPAVIGKNPLDKILPQRQVVEPSFLLQWQQGEALNDLTGEHASAVALGHAVLFVDTDTEQT